FLLACVLLLLAAFFIAKRGSRVSDTAGFMSWIMLIFYFPVEWIVTSRMISTYSFMNQPMSDLGVERCMSHAYSLAPYHICSPLSGLMNITFIVTGKIGRASCRARGEVPADEGEPQETRPRLAQS